MNPETLSLMKIHERVQYDKWVIVRDGKIFYSLKLGGVALHNLTASIVFEKIYHDDIYKTNSNYERFVKYLEF